MTLDPFRNYDAWLEAPYQRFAEAPEDEHAEDCRCRECDPDLARDEDEARL